MGYVPPHTYILTGDERFRDDFEKQQKRDAIGIAITGIVCLLVIVGGAIYSLIQIGG